MPMYEQRSAYENLTRFNFMGEGKYDIPIIYNDDVNFMVKNQATKSWYQGAYQFALENPSAKEIIEKYKNYY